MQLKDPTLLKSQSYIDGQWVGEGADPVDNPATGEVLGKVPAMARRKPARRSTRRRPPSGRGRGSSPRSARRSCANGSS